VVVAATVPGHVSEAHCAAWAVPPSNHRCLDERLPRSKLDLIDAGHFTWEDAGDQYAEIVTGWWAGGHERA
jgi:pimeloyl-ACP methyl ester carboxylesterase